MRIGIPWIGLDAKLDHLERLGELKERGLLTAAEFREEKKKVLAS